MPPLLFTGVRLVASVSVGSVIAGIVKNNIAAETLVQKVAVNVASIVLGSMAMDQAAKHVDETLKTITAQIEEGKQEEDSEKAKKTEGP